MKVLDTISNSLSKVLSVFLGTALAVLFVVITMQTFARYIFNIGIFWTDELARYLHVWTVVLCGGLLCADESHIRVTMVEEKFPMFTTPIAIIRHLVAIGFGIAIAYFTSSILATGALSVSSNLRIPMNIVYLCFPVSSVLIIFYSVVNLIRIFLRKPQKRNDEEGGEK